MFMMFVKLVWFSRLKVAGMLMVAGVLMVQGGFRIRIRTGLLRKFCSGRRHIRY
jgi:hypothetical protein